MAGWLGLEAEIITSCSTDGKQEGFWEKGSREKGFWEWGLETDRQTNRHTDWETEKEQKGESILGWPDL